jgi:hypothetical protein
VAQTFRADSRAFQADEEGGSESTAALHQMMTTIFDSTSAELAALIDRGDEGMTAIEDEGIVSFLEIRASRKELMEIRDKLHGLLQSLATADEHGTETEDSERYRLTLAYYPLEKTSPPRRRSASRSRGGRPRGDSGA